ncbi:cytochrome P450 78A7-like [Chenopodium quinoa]|uniref:Cytochrome P450 n=1 Tax=Chenopodium quinoa TaxID=63459 RepID=A0A803MSB8_CHEQI|nr:cytochrome P450 78A7-like [Chenopodium quinoa]
MAATIPNDEKLWLFFTLPQIITFENIISTNLTSFPFLATLIVLYFLGLFTWAIFSSPGGPAWKKGRNHMGQVPIPSPKGLPVFGSLFTLSHGLAHQTLAYMAQGFGSKQLMALSLGSTPVVVTSDPEIAREILTSPYFADRPIKQSAKQLMFSRAIGFAPSGAHWRLLRRIAASHLFSPRRILAHESGRMLECTNMVNAIFKEQVLHGVVSIRKHLQAAALNNIMGSVFGKRYDLMNGEGNMSHEAKELDELVKEGFELLGAFNWSDHLPWLKHFCDPSGIVQRCSSLVPHVRRLVQLIIDEHRERRMNNGSDASENSDFVDVLLSLEGEEKLQEDDMVAVLWEMIFRGTDTIALLIEWILAELVLNPTIQSKLQNEIANAMESAATNSAIAKLPYLQAVVKETLRLHPPGPLLSWARLSTTNVSLSNGMVVPKGTTTMVNMWSITHDPNVWDNPAMFNPERFLHNSATAGIDIDVRGSDLRLAPFGAGRRVCPGKDLALVTVSQWVAMLVHNFKWIQHETNPIDLGEVLKLSCEMKCPLSAVAIPRNCFVTKQYKY